MSTVIENTAELTDTCEKLRKLQKSKAAMIKTKIMIGNRLVSNVATFEGYQSSLDEAERKAMFDKARALIKEIKGGLDHKLQGLVICASQALDGFDHQVTLIEKDMLKLTKTLHVVDWVGDKDRKGFGLLSLATLIGETGNLFNYANPGKVWRRMGCAPFTKQSTGETLMGATWRSRSKNGLSAEEWTEYAYSPRRRSIAFVIGECLIKQNWETHKVTKEPLWVGPYRKRYDDKKAEIAKLHEGDPAYTKLRCHRHGMLLATKTLMRDLWIVWTGVEYKPWTAN